MSAAAAMSAAAEVKGAAGAGRKRREGRNSTTRGRRRSSRPLNDACRHAPHRGPLHVFILHRSTFCGFLVFGPCVLTVLCFLCGEAPRVGGVSRRVLLGDELKEGTERDWSFGCPREGSHSAQHFSVVRPSPGTTHSLRLDVRVRFFLEEKSRAARRKESCSVRQGSLTGERRSIRERCMAVFLLCVWSARVV